MMVLRGSAMYSSQQFNLGDVLQITKAETK